MRPSRDKSSLNLKKKHLAGRGIDYYGFFIMSFENFKLYGVCVERLKHQLALARKRVGDRPVDRVVLEGYQTGDIDEIIDILELYDIEEKTPEAFRGKLEDLAHDVSLFIKETIEFGYDDNGNLCLYWKVKGPGDYEI
jgi:hypothetical protein